MGNPQFEIYIAYVDQPLQPLIWGHILFTTFSTCPPVSEKELIYSQSQSAEIYTAGKAIMAKHLYIPSCEELI